MKGHGGGQDTYSSSSNPDPLASLFADEQYVRPIIPSIAPTDQSSQSQSVQTQTTISANPDLAQRDAEISSIAQSITDLADMFKDLSSLVIDQGTLLDRVDWNVEQMGTDVKAAVEELKIATTFVPTLFPILCVKTDERG